MASGPQRRAPPGLPEELKRLQAELLAGLDSGEEEAAEEPSSALSSRPDPLHERSVLSVAGEEKVEEVTTLILREQGLQSLSPPGALDFARLVSLEVLSLSHNRLQDISALASLISLQEVNLNFNEICDLSPLHECEQLIKLFASHNQVASVTGLETGCPQLRELSLFCNKLSDTGAVLRTLQRLPELRVLDLGENECCSGPSQRYTILQGLSQLESLDGSRLGDLDRQLASAFFQGDGAVQQDVCSREPSPEAPDTSPVRPRTAPAAASRPPMLPGRSASGSVAFHLPGQRLRSSQANLIDEVLTQSREPSPEAVGGLPVLDLQKLDMSKPEASLGKLNIYVEALDRHLQVLQMERENLKFELRLLERDRRDAGQEGLREQIGLLEEENQNLSAVESEHQLLLSRLEKAEREESATQAASARGQRPEEDGDDDDEDLLSELKWEGQLLRKRLRRLQDYAQHLQEDELRVRLKSGGAAGQSLGREEEEADDDPELTRLLVENEARLREVRSEVRDTATALARSREVAAATGPADPRGVAGVDVLTIGEGAPDVEWHGTR